MGLMWWVGLVVGWFVASHFITPALFSGDAFAAIKKITAGATPAQRAAARTQAIKNGATPADLAKSGL